MRAFALLALAALIATGACSSAAPAPTPTTASQAPAASAAPPVAAAPTATPAPVSVRYGIAATSLNFIPARMAVEQGFYKQYGIDVEILQIAAGAQSAAQVAGELEYTTAYPPAIRIAANGAPLRVVSTLVGAPLFVMLSRPEVASTADLRGRAIGITTRGGAQDKATRDMLAKLGYDADTDVNIVPAGAQTPLLVDALVANRIQVAALSPPWHIRARDQGMRVLASGPDLVKEPQNGLIVHEDRLTRQRDQVRNMIQAEIQAIRFMKENRAATIAVSRDWLSISDAEADASYDFVVSALIPDCAVDVEGIEAFLAAEKADGNIPADTRLSQVADVTVAAEAARAVGATRQ
jgi:ABC-type nitrate/sulfonate/bicarbonate transport system substrate-binding protein